MAFESGAGRTRVPVRTGFVAAVLGVAGITAALVFAASLDQLVASPARYGAAWDFKTVDVTSNTPCGAGARGLDRVPGVVALTEVCSQSVQVDGRPTPGLAYRRLRGAPIGTAIVTGRAPELPGEVALGSKTLTVLHKHVGDRVHVVTRSGAEDYRIVGRAAFPTVAQAQPLADGIAFTGAGYARIFDQNIFLRIFVGRYATGAHAADVDTAISRIPGLSDVSSPTVPTEIDRLRQVDWLPVALATMLGLLALVAVAHALVVSARRRNRELAVLKALGFTRRDVRHGCVAGDRARARRTPDRGPGRRLRRAVGVAARRRGARCDGRRDDPGARGARDGGHRTRSGQRGRDRAGPGGGARRPGGSSAHGVAVDRPRRRRFLVGTARWIGRCVDRV